MSARHLALVLALTTSAAVVAAQPAASPATAGQTARAAGMALHDGTLPPGTITVRIVQGDFSGNVAGVRVNLDTVGHAEKSAMTGADGRAQFAHLTVGTTVRVRAAVEGERLESESIVLPTDSGVRVLLVAGDRFVDTTKPGEVASLPPLATAPPLESDTRLPGTGADEVRTTPVTASPATAIDDGAATLRAVTIALTVLAFALVAYGQWKRRHQVPGSR